MFLKKKNLKYTFCILTLIGAMALTGCTSKKTPKSEDNATSAGSAHAKAASETAADVKLHLNLSESTTLSDAASQGATFQSEDDSIATVDTQGNVQGIKHGKTKITATAGNTTTVYHVNVRKRGMVYPSFSMMKGEHLDLQFSNQEQAASYTWTSSDNSIAKITKKGIVKAKGIGSAVLTGTSGDHTYTCNLEVTKKIKSTIYLTFDDGPNSYSTPKVLNILKKNDVKATFFELRPASYDYKLTQRVIDEGHTLALHGFQHKYDQIYKSEQIYHDNLDKLRNLFFKKFGVWCTLSRFPGGSSNTVSHYNPGIMTKLTKELDGWGYHYMDWNVSSGDAGGANSSAEVLRNVKNELVKGHENVILMHDFANNDKTINALDDVIKYGKSHGYTFLPLTASTDAIHHGVNN